MKKIIVLAISAILVANVSAQEVKAGKAECKKDKKECKMSCEERINRDIQWLTEELYLSEEQAAKFAVTYREFIAEKVKLNEKFKAKFAKDLNERQVERVLRFHGPKPQGPKPDFEKGPRPDFDKGQRPHKREKKG